MLARIILLYLTLLLGLFGCGIEIKFVKPTITVSGGAWFDDNIRGLKLKVCNLEAINKITTIQEKHQQAFDEKESKEKMSYEFSDFSANMAIFYFIEEIKPILNDPSLCLDKGNTDIDGKYNFTIEKSQIKQGYQYLLTNEYERKYQFKSEITGNMSEGTTYHHWIVKIPTNPPEENIKIDLNIENSLRFIAQNDLQRSYIKPKF